MEEKFAFQWKFKRKIPHKTQIKPYLVFSLFIDVYDHFLVIFRDNGGTRWGGGFF